MKRRVCSYDMFAVPDPSFVLKNTGGEMYFCNCMLLSLVDDARSGPNLSVEIKTVSSR
jgi:hypothetical protein